MVRPTREPNHANDMIDPTRQRRPPNRLGCAHHLVPCQDVRRLRGTTTAQSGRCSQDGRRLANIGITACCLRISTFGPTRCLAFDGSLGHFTEVLSGDYYQSFETSSPHQIWSAAMVVSPILRGMFGLETDASNHEITFAPHVPANWTSFAIRNIHLELGNHVDFQYRKTPRQHRA